MILGAAGDASRFINHDTNALLDDMRNLAGKTRVSVTQTTTTGVLVTIGQSLMANYNDTPYTAGSTVYNFNSYDGRCYVCADPLLGCAGDGVQHGFSGICGNQAGRIADALIAAGEFTHCVVAPTAVGGTEIARWADTGDLSQRYKVCFSRLREQGFTPTAVLLEIGQQDSVLGTAQAAWEASFSSFRTAVRRYTSAPIFVAQCTWRPSTSNATVRAAQAAVVNAGLGVYAGPDIDTLTGSNRQAGSPHLSATGAAAAALLWRNAIQAVI